jgi:hypothetical protein
LNGVLFPAGASIALQIALRIAVIYPVVPIGVPLSGKREVGQITPFDLTLLLQLSNSVQNAVDTKLTSWYEVHFLTNRALDEFPLTTSFCSIGPSFDGDEPYADRLAYLQRLAGGREFAGLLVDAK